MVVQSVGIKGVMMFVQTALGVAGVSAALLAAVYQTVLAPNFKIAGLGYVVQPLANNRCIKHLSTEACEKIVRHDASGLLYMACSTPQARSNWCPALNRLNGQNVLFSKDYFAIFDPSSPNSPARKLQIKDFYDPRGIYVHGMDVVPSSTSPDELFIYAVNHRPPTPPEDAAKVGADSVIEVFKTVVGSDTLEHLRTVKHSLIVTPNDIVGSPDGTSFWVTNDHGEKVGFSRVVETYIGKKSTSVIYCDVNDKKSVGGCKVSVAGLRSCNGIARDPRVGDKRFYVVDSLHGEVTILEKQKDNRLVVTDNFKVGKCLDNVSVDKDGTLYLAAWARGIDIPNHIKNTSNPIATSVYKVTINTAKSSFFGEKYKVEKIFEDDGQVASAITTAIWDAKRKKLWMHGLTSPWLVSCDL